jgi:Reverse transcriptase (RNA-dependent DNA polymerase)
VLNELDVMAANIGNVYLNAYTAEKVFMITGPEFGEESNRVAVMVRALYGLKSNGAAWHACFAQSLLDLGFVSCQSDRDIWQRTAMKKDGTDY